MCDIFSKSFVEYLAADLGVSEQNIENSIRGFVNKLKLPNRVEYEIEPKIKSSNLTKKCCRIINGKNAPCGKDAQSVISANGVEMWYCGSSNSGCYSILASNSDSIVNTQKNDPIVLKTVLSKVSPKSLEFKKIKIGKKTVTVGCHDKDQIVFENDKACGRIEGKKIIEELTQDQIRYLEANKYQILDKIKPKTRIIPQASKLIKFDSSEEEEEKQELEEESEEEKQEFDEESEEMDFEEESEGEIDFDDSQEIDFDDSQEEIDYSEEEEIYEGGVDSEEIDLEELASEEEE